MTGASETPAGGSVLGLEDAARRAVELRCAWAQHERAGDAVAASKAAFELGRTQEMLLCNEEAAVWYERVWRYEMGEEARDARAAHAARSLGWLCSQAGRDGEAVRWYERAYELKRLGVAAAEAVYLAATALYRLGAQFKGGEPARLWRARALEWQAGASAHATYPRLELTAAQEAELRAEVEQWIDMSRSTAPADRVLVEAAIARLYCLSGFNRPRIVWEQSPAAAWATSVTHGALPRDQLSLEQLYSEAYKSSLHVPSQLGHRQPVSLCNLYADLRSFLWDALGEQVRGQLAASGSLGMGPFFRADGGATTLRGAHDAALLAASIFCRDRLGVLYPATLNERLDCWKILVRSCFSWLPFRELCVVCEHPSTLRNDPRGRLHSPEGPALGFRDGWAIYVWHGTRVPAEWLTERRQVDPMLAFTWPNIEQRRALVEILGWKAILERVTPIVIDEDPDPQVGTLLSVDRGSQPPVQLLRVQCGTGRRFVLVVPPHVRTAREANAWTYGLGASDYELEVRT